MLTSITSNVSCILSIIPSYTFCSRLWLHCSWRSSPIPHQWWWPCLRGGVNHSRWGYSTGVLWGVSHPDHRLGCSRKCSSSCCCHSGPRLVSTVNIEPHLTCTQIMQRSCVTAICLVYSFCRSTLPIWRCSRWCCCSIRNFCWCHFTSTDTVTNISLLWKRWRYYLCKRIHREWCMKEWRYYLCKRIHREWCMNEWRYYTCSILGD